MNLLFHGCSLCALACMLYGTYVTLTQSEDFVTRYVQRSFLGFSMLLFFCGCLVGLVPA